MIREASFVRPDFIEQARQIGFTYSGNDENRYWDESFRYIFRRRQIEEDLETATINLGALCVELAGLIVGSQRMMDRLRIPDHARDVIAQSWRRRDASLYGRFDFAYDGKSPPKLLEFNADTPTTLFESAIVQWLWLEQMIATGSLPPRASSDQTESFDDQDDALKTES